MKGCWRSGRNKTGGWREDGNWGYRVERCRGKGVTGESRGRERIGWVLVICTLAAYAPGLRLLHSLPENWENQYTHSLVYPHMNWIIKNI